MCGLVALLSKRQHGFFSTDADIFRHMLYADALRGWDATGYFAINKHGNVDVAKQAVAAGPFLLNPENNSLNSKIINEYRMIIGHNRKATHGEKRNEDAHPFWSENENIVLVHNGMVSNHKEFCKKATVDSAAICEAISTTDNVKELLGKITGAFVFIWYNVEQKKLYYVRNDQRPLYLIETEDTLAMASEPKLAEWIYARHNKQVKKVSAVTPMHLFSIKLGENIINDEGEVKKKDTFFHGTTPIRTVPAIVQNFPKQNNFGVNTTVSNTFEELDDTMMLSEDDIAKPEYALAYYQKGKKVPFLISTYDECVSVSSGEIYYKVAALPINTNQCETAIIRFFMSKTEFDAADFTKVHIGTIMSANRDGADHVDIYVRDIHISEHVTSLNGTIITREHYDGLNFPNTCDECNGSVYWGTLKYSAIKMEYGFVTECTCPKCTEINNHKNAA